MPKSARRQSGCLWKMNTMIRSGTYKQTLFRPLKTSFASAKRSPNNHSLTLARLSVYLPAMISQQISFDKG